MTARISLALCAVSALACRSGVPEPSVQPLFENDDIPELTLLSDPELSLGGSITQEETAFFKIRGARLLPTGGIVVADGSTQELRFFDLEGNHRATVGGEGHGPGEFQVLDWIGCTGESLLAWDIQTLRLTEFSLGGELVGTDRLDLDDASLNRPPIVGALIEGGILFRDGRSGSTVGAPSGSIGRDSVSYLRVERNGAGTEVIHAGEGPERYVQIEDHLRQKVELLFGRDARDAVVGNFLFFATTDSLTITRLDPRDGGHLTRRFGWAPRRLSPAEVEAERRKQLDDRLSLMGRSLRSIRISQADEDRIIESIERAVSGVPARETYPAFGNLRPDGTGGLWVAESVSPLDRNQRWVLLDTLLEPTARAVLPTRWQIQDMRVPHIAVLERDSLGVEYIRVYRLTGVGPVAGARDGER